jgi:chromosome condensin MukBEF complex kleisin-like MukF subunit
MSDEEIMSLLRAIKEQLNTMETRQVIMDERQKAIKQEVAEQEQGSFGSRDK